MQSPDSASHDPRGTDFLNQMIAPWTDSLSQPEDSQSRTLMSLLEGYSKTGYGRSFGADSVDSFESYRNRFPVATYATLAPLFERVKDGEYGVILPEPPRMWVMTRGSTGRSKVIPVTEAHLGLILSMGARAVVNFALRREMEVLETPVLNLNFPSKVNELEAGDPGSSYGYSSGSYARLFPELKGARLIPRQEEIDELGGGISSADWRRRFELVYQAAKSVDIGSLMGVTPVMLAFASFVKRAHGKRPKDLWRPRALFCTSVAKIHSKYEPELRHHYGSVQVVEMYTATEGVFAQQVDALPYVSPNYDGYLFEVETGAGFRMLHELRPNEWGRLVVSTPMLPRYAIGDLIESMGKGYFRVFGRDRLTTVLEHRIFNLMSFRF